jgi:hypothetical protein
MQAATDPQLPNEWSNFPPIPKKINLNINKAGDKLENIWEKLQLAFPNRFSK